MAKQFIYDSVGTLEATLVDGTSDGSTFSSSNTISNESRFIDGSIATSPTSFGNGDAIRLDFGSSVAASAVALYFTDSETNDIIIYASDNSNQSSATTIATLSTAFSAGWSVTTFTEATKRYWFLRSSNGTVDNLAEVIIGKVYTFDQEPNVGAKTGVLPGNTVHKSIGGQEYGFKKHEPLKFWDYKFDFLGSSAKTNLESFRDAVDNGFKKFVYYDGSSYHWVRMSEDSLNFTEVLPSIYNTSIKLHQQIS